MKIETKPSRFKMILKTKIIIDFRNYYFSLANNGTS